MASKKKLHKPTITYSVGKFRFLFYKGRKMSYGYLQELGVSSQVISETKKRLGLLDSPGGSYGAPVRGEREPLLDFVTQLLSDDRAEGTHFDRDQLEIKVRYHVMLNDTITCDEPPATMDGVPDYYKNKGYKNLDIANAYAEKTFEYYSKFLKDDKNKPIQLVRLELKDKEGAIIVKKTNGYKKP